MVKKHLIALALLFSAVLAHAEKPNILVILTDDLGFSDIGCYGSEIETPNLDRLAADGLRFNQFYNTAKCHSSRVSLLTGRYCRQAGDEKMNRAFTIPEILLPAGYSTLMTGKWHLDKEPTDFGFQRYFGHLSGATNFFRGDNTFRLDGEKWQVPETGFYTTTANVDFALAFLNDARTTEKPWFLYVAFNAPHAPLQPLKEDYETYRHNYGNGWDAMNAARNKKQKQLGLIGADVPPSPRPDHIPAWDTLTPELRDWESRRMAALAAMISRVDKETGRLIADLETSGELDNTLIIFLSDNGACPYDRPSRGMEMEPYEPGANWSDSTGWAWARNTPFRFYKQNQFEGGISTPAIFHWPAGITTQKGAITDQPAHLIDLLPTIAEITGAEIPTTFPGREPTPLAGVSIAPVFSGEKLESRPPIHLLFAKDRGLRDGDWKLVSLRSQPWELYNIPEDRTELHNLAAQHPERVAAMSKLWHDMAENVLMAPEKETKPVADRAGNPTNPEWSDYSGKKGSLTSPKMIRDKGKNPQEK